MPTSTEIKTIKIRVLLFASLSEYLGTNEITLEIKQGSTIKDLQDLLFDKLDSRKQWNKPLLYAVNQCFVSLDTGLNEGDEIVFMPFVSGG